MEYRLTDFLPTTKKELELRGWDYVDVILFSGDAYVDHPSFGAAVIGRVLEAAHLPGMRVDRCRCAAASPSDLEAVDDFSQLTFADMLDATEALVARAIESMQAGRVCPDPATPDACTYCPVAHCPYRM